MGQKAVFTRFHIVQESTKKATKSFKVPLKSLDVLRRLQD